MIDTVRDLAHTGDVPGDHLRVRPRAVLRGRAPAQVVPAVHDRRGEGARSRRCATRRCCRRACAKELRPLLTHGIGIHHAGILPRYKQLVEQLALERLIKFVVSTETIAAGINLPARTVVFPSLRKFIKQQARLRHRRPSTTRWRAAPGARSSTTRASRSRSRPRRSSASSRRSSRTRRSAPAYDEAQGQARASTTARAATRSASGDVDLDAGGPRRARQGRAGRAAQQDQDHRRAGARDRPARSHRRPSSPAQPSAEAAHGARPRRRCRRRCGSTS